jgi:hypothetical protein
MFFPKDRYFADHVKFRTGSADIIDNVRVHDDTGMITQVITSPPKHPRARRSAVSIMQMQCQFLRFHFSKYEIHMREMKC